MTNIRGFLYFMLCLVGVYGEVEFRNSEQKKMFWSEVQELCDDYWNWRIKDMPQFATFVGIHDYNAELDDMSMFAYYKRYRKCGCFLKRAQKLLPQLTNEADKISIEVLMYELQTYIGSYKLKGYYLPVNRLEGPQVDMEKLFGWMPKNTYEDYVAMTTRMRKIPRQMNQIIRLLTAGVKDDITYHGNSVNNLNDTIGRFVVSDPKESPLYAFFASEFPENFTEEQIATLQKNAQNVISCKVTPAYEKLRNYMVKDYLPRPNIAVTTINRGKEFYASLIWFHTSTNLSAQDIHDIGLNEVDRIATEMKKIINETGNGDMSIEDYSTMLRNDANNFYNNSEDLMEGYNHIAYDLIIPRLQMLFKNIPEAKLSIVPDPNPDGPSAFYLGGSYDGSRPGVFYVNTYDPNSQGKYDMVTLSLHEGNPGHHLQTSYSIESPDFPFFRRVMEDRNYGISPSRFPIYTYFVEGWALYAESLGFDMELYEDSLDRYGHYSEEMFRACRLVVDTGMHALNWTRNEAIEFMYNNTASSLHEIENEVDRYITWPGQALSYKMGQLKISEMRKWSTSQLGELFDIKEFHDVLLSSFGPMNIVQNQIQKWVHQILNGNQTHN